MVGHCILSELMPHSDAAVAFVSNVSGLQPHASLQHGKLWYCVDHMTDVEHKTARSMASEYSIFTVIHACRFLKALLSPKCKSNVVIF